MTFNPGMMGLDPQQMQAAREIGKHVRLEMRKSVKQGRLEIQYVAVNPEDTKALDAIANCVESFAMQMAAMHDTFFGIKGKITNMD
jgi:hypothetical protein